MGQYIVITNQSFSYMMNQYTLFCFSMRYTSAVIILINFWGNGFLLHHMK